MFIKQLSHVFKCLDSKKVEIPTQQKCHIFSYIWEPKKHRKKQYFFDQTIINIFRKHFKTDLLIELVVIVIFEQMLTPPPWATLERTNVRRKRRRRQVFIRPEGSEFFSVLTRLCLQASSYLSSSNLFIATTYILRVMHI
jgi:hypothetical protein